MVWNVSRVSPAGRRYLCRRDIVRRLKCDCDMMRSLANSCPSARINFDWCSCPLPRFSCVFSPSFLYIPDESIRLWWNRRLQFRSYKDLFDNWVTWRPKTFAFLIPNYRYCNWRGFQNAVLSVSVATTDRMKYKQSNVSNEFFLNGLKMETWLEDWEWEIKWLNNQLKAGGLGAPIQIAGFFGWLLRSWPRWIEAQIQSAEFVGWLLPRTSPARTIDKIHVIRKWFNNSHAWRSRLEPCNNQPKELEDLKDLNQKESEIEACLEVPLEAQLQ